MWKQAGLIISAAFIILGLTHAFAANITPFPGGLMLCNSTQSAGVAIDASNCTSVITMPRGVTGSRPGGVLAGSYWWNTTLSGIEIFDGVNWNLFPQPMTFLSSPTHSIVTTAAAANGWQLSASRVSHISYSVLVTVTASIASGQSGYVVLEIAPTNSAIAADWVEVGRVSSSQTYTLAIAIQGVQGTGGSMSVFVPAGSYARLRSVNVTGTPSYTFVSGQEALN